MSTAPCKPLARPADQMRDKRHPAILRESLSWLVLASVLACSSVHALTSDRDKEMNIHSDYSSMKESKSGNGQNATYLKGNVEISQGTLKVTSADATIEQAGGGTKDAQDQDIGGQISRVVLTGNPAHLEQRQDNGDMMRASARKIVYELANNSVDLSGNVIVDQENRGKFSAEHMTYNTVTGTMESGAGSSGRVHMQILPRKHPAKPAASGSDDAKSAPSDTPAALMLTASGLQKSYRGRPVVRNFEFSLDQGEIVGLLGPNGAGKTTCFYMIVGLIPADAGSVRLDGEDITSLPMHLRARRGVGYLPQEPSVFRRLTVRENVLAILELRRDLDEDGRNAELESLLDELQIAHIADTKGFSLSGGERRRVEITRALAARPRFLLLDEPFAGIDPISVVEIQRIVLQLKSRGIGILITDHNVRETLGICERAYILNEGEILAQGPPAEVLTNDQVREVYLGHEFRM